jgi:hypothetical protein
MTVQGSTGYWLLVSGRWLKIMDSGYEMPDTGFFFC